MKPAKQTGFQLRLLVPGNYGDEIQTMLSARHQEAMEPPSEFNLLSGFGPFGKPKLNPEQVAQLRQRAQAGEKKAVLARQFGVSRETLYSYLRSSSVGGGN